MIPLIITAIICLTLSGLTFMGLQYRFKMQTMLRQNALDVERENRKYLLAANSEDSNDNIDARNEVAKIATDVAVSYKNLANDAIRDYSRDSYLDKAAEMSKLAGNVIMLESIDDPDW